MNISLITHDAHGSNGGIAKYTSFVINALASNFDIKKINIFSKRKILLKKKKINFFQSRFFLFIILKNTIKIIKSDLILVSHINLIPYLLVIFFFNKKVILFSYGYEIWGLKKNFFYRLLIKRINYFICMRKYTAKIQKKKYNLNDKSFFFLHNCIDEDTKRYKFNKDQNNIITVARLDKLEKYKGVDETLEALSLIKKKTFKYYIVGDGNDTKRLKDKTKILKLQNEVIFTGYVSDKRRDQLLKKSCICSTPGSHFPFDTYPYRFSFLEAAQLGLHLIASSPQNDEKKIAHKYHNINFVNPRSIKDIKKMIQKLIKRKKFICPKLTKDFSYNRFKNNLNNHINIIINKS